MNNLIYDLPKILLLIKLQVKISFVLLLSY